MIIALTIKLLALLKNEHIHGTSKTCMLSGFHLMEAGEGEGRGGGGGAGGKLPPQTLQLPPKLYLIMKTLALCCFYSCIGD